LKKEKWWGKETKKKDIFFPILNLVALFDEGD